MPLIHRGSMNYHIMLFKRYYKTKGEREAKRDEADIEKCGGKDCAKACQ